jgi:hypothetical protein
MRAARDAGSQQLIVLPRDPRGILSSDVAKVRDTASSDRLIEYVQENLFSPID